jgi:stearoyl-CoA desaturase (delta-9 desaturase)
MQVLIALAGIQCGLRGPLWWASKHRDHHMFVETKRDPHSPIAHSFWYAYLVWMRAPGNFDTDLDRIPDFARYPELRWLNRFYAIPLYAGAALTFGAGYFGWLGGGVSGVAALLWGFYVPTLLVLHAGGLVATVTHMPKVPGAYRRYATPDCSVNRPLLGVVLLGAGWHNNHHRYPASARAGFAWYELDLSYWILRALAAMRIIRGLRAHVPADVLSEGGIGKRTAAART